MSRKYSIGFLICILIFIVFLMVGYKISYNKALERNDYMEQEIHSDYSYVLKEKEGYITVYQQDGQVYEYTSILISDLPQSIQKELKTGIEAENLAEVYGFLENYSS